MGYEGRWGEARDALAGIAKEAIKYDSDGVDLCFFNSQQKCVAVKVWVAFPAMDDDWLVISLGRIHHYLHLQQTAALRYESKGICRLRSNACPIGGTPTGAVLKTLLDKEIGKLELSIGKPEYKEIKPLDIIVITDGVPSWCFISLWLSVLQTQLSSRWQTLRRPCGSLHSSQVIPTSS